MSKIKKNKTCFGEPRLWRLAARCGTNTKTSRRRRQNTCANCSPNPKPQESSRTTEAATERCVVQWTRWVLNTNRLNSIPAGTNKTDDALMCVPLGRSVFITREPSMRDGKRPRVRRGASGAEYRSRLTLRLDAVSRNHLTLRFSAESLPRLFTTSY
jgi:hypothetical protein